MVWCLTSISRQRRWPHRREFPPISRSALWFGRQFPLESSQFEQPWIKSLLLGWTAWCYWHPINNLNTWLAGPHSHRRRGYLIFLIFVIVGSAWWERLGCCASVHCIFRPGSIVEDWKALTSVFFYFIFYSFFWMSFSINKLVKMLWEKFSLENWEFLNDKS